MTQGIAKEGVVRLRLISLVMFSVLSKAASTPRWEGYDCVSGSMVILDSG